MITEKKTLIIYSNLHKVQLFGGMDKRRIMSRKMQGTAEGLHGRRLAPFRNVTHLEKLLRPTGIIACLLQVYPEAFGGVLI